MAGKPQVCTVDDCDSRPVGRRLCRAHYQAAWKAGELEAHALVPKRPRVRDRKVCPPEHKHAGSTTCYIQHQCRCDPCMDHHTAVSSRRERLKAYGRFDAGFVDVGPVREHMLLLAEFGMGYKRIAKLAGFGSSTPARNIIWGRQDPGRVGEMQRRVKRETAVAIMRVRPSVENLAGGAKVPARGVHRRVQALVARGWSLSKIGRLIGMDIRNFLTLMKRDRVLVSTYRAVCDVYEELWDRLPDRSTPPQEASYTRALKYAQRRGWVPPLAWDDIDLDPAPPNPLEDADGESVIWKDVVDHAAVELAVTGAKVHLTKASRREAVRRLYARRWSHARIAEQLHCALETVQRIEAELGLAAWSKEQIEAGTFSPRQGRRAAA